MISKSLLEEIANYYNPDSSFAYGSGVFKQKSYNSHDNPMIDLIFGVESTLNWHEKNLYENEKDYSFLCKNLGLGFIDYLQNKEPKVYYNPFVKFGEYKIKYGVISTKNLIGDLTNWEYIYIAGRFHKPVKKIKSCQKINNAIKTNLQHAVKTALLLLPEHFTEQKLYETIAGISYLGDIRMKNFENPDKVINIVSKNFDGFHNLYKSIVESNKNIARLNAGRMQQNTSPLITKSMFNELPQNIKEKIICSNFTDREQLSEEIKNRIFEIVRNSSKQQALNGLITTGLFNSLKYTREKRKKAKRIKKDSGKRIEDEPINESQYL